MFLQLIVRNLKKHPFLNLIKILGLALALSGIVFIITFIHLELSYDGYHQKADRIYRFTITDPGFFNNNHFARIYNAQIVPDLKEHFPEIENFIRLGIIRGGVMLHDKKYYNINQAFVCDSSFFDIFDAELLAGDKKTILNNPATMVITENFAKKIFGNSNPIGEIISLPPGQYYGEQTDFTVKGIMKNFPQNSHFHPDVITTSATGTINDWAWTYLLLSEHADPEKIASEYPAFLTKQNNIPVEKIKTIAHLQKLTDIHLHSHKLREIEVNGNITNLYVLAIAALILLLISMSNFASLNWGMSANNDKFIIVNRILGSSRYTNLKYSFIESLMIVLLSVFISLCIISQVNIFIISRYNLNLLNGHFLLISFIFLIFIILGILSGLQPSINQLFKKISINTLSRKVSNKHNLTVSKGIVILQYAFANILIVAVFIIARQTNFVLKNSLGVEENNVICFESVHSNVQKKFDVFKSELLKYNAIESVSAMMDPPGGEANDMFEFELEGYKKQDEEQIQRIGIVPCDYSFADVFKLEFLSGKDFSDHFLDNQGSGEYIINEAALHQFNYKVPASIIGKRFKLNTNIPGIDLPEGEIIGVVKDFHISDMKSKVNPLVLFKRKDLWIANFVISYKPGMKNEALSQIESIWKKMFLEYPFNYEYTSSIYRKIYKTELLQTYLLSAFSIIAIFICSMGILGLSLLITNQRTKEIGIRKVNGAKINEVMTMLNTEFIKWVIIAFIISTPAAYFAMNEWLENFAYKTGLSWWIFALAGIMSLTIVLLTVSWQSLKVARRNPVEALRYE